MNDLLQLWTVKTSSNMSAIIYPWSDLTIVKIDHGCKSLVFSEEIQGNDHFLNIFCDGMNIRVPFDV